MPESLAISAVQRNPNLYEAVSEQLLTAIRSAGLAPGTRIPSERELGDRFGVSRTVVREAVRHLAAKGVLEVVSGSGVIVADVGSENVSESIGLFLRQRGPVDPAQVHEVRRVLEQTTAGLAADRATTDQIAELGRLCNELEASATDPTAASDADVAFHRTLAEASGNPLFVVLIDSLSDVLLQLRHATLDDPARGRTAADAHRRIAEAVRDRDPNAAIKAMHDHLTDSFQEYTKRAGDAG